MQPSNDLTISDIVEGALAGPELASWLAANPERAAEVELAQRVRALLQQLRAAELEVPADLEARVLAQIRGDRTLSELLDLCLNGFGRAVIELLTILFGQTPPLRGSA